MDGNAGLRAMQEIVDRMTSEGASQEDIDAALMEFAYRHEHGEDQADSEVPADTTSADEYFARACECFENFDDVGALTLLHRALDVNPAHYDARRMLLQLECTDEELYLRMGDLDRELTDRCKALSAAPQSAGELTDAWEDPELRALVRIKADRAFLAYDLGRYRPALAACEEALALDPKDRQNVRGLLVMLHAFFEDEPAVRRLHERFGNEQSSWFLLGRALAAYKVAKLDEAKRQMDALFAAYPDFFVTFSLFMAGGQTSSVRTSDDRERQRDEVFGALEDAVAIIDSTPGYLAWLAEVYAAEIFAE